MEIVLATLLAPLLPYLLDKTRDSAGRATEAVGSAAWDRAKRIWGRLWPKVQDKEGAREAVETLAQNPDDEAARGALQFQLRKILAADPALAQDLDRMVREGQQVGVIADNGAVVVVGGVKADRGGVAVGGSISGLQGGIQTHWQGD